MKRRLLLYSFVAFLLVSVGVSCNDDDDSESSSVATYTSASTAITGFYLIDNSDILDNLDSVYFTIDLKGARIYNADSLPKGTDISRMLVQLTYPSCYSVEVAISDAERLNDTTFAYTNSDTIDFTGDVKITVTALDQVTYRTYDVQVNVHQLESDSLQWGDIAYSSLPSMYGNVTEQKTVSYNDDVYCLMSDNGYFVLASADSPTDAWSKQVVEFQFTPDVRSFTATDDAFYILPLSHDDLYTSSDGVNWTSCGVQWSQIMGAYGDRVLGVAYDDNGYSYDEYPRRTGFTPVAVDASFPVSGSSNLIIYDNEWGTSSIGICFGGMTSTSEYVGKAWGYDGDSWSVLSNNEIEGRIGMSLVSYTTYYTDTSNWEYTAYPTFLAWGGFTESGEVDKTLYMSRDMGVNWSVADSLMQLPDAIPAMYNADVVVFNTTMSDDGVVTNSSSVGTLSWRNIATPDMPVWYNTATPVLLSTGSLTRSYGGDGVSPVTEWDVPYIYMFGGCDYYGSTYDTVWKGVLNRLTYKPIY